MTDWIQAQRHYFESLLARTLPDDSHSLLLKAMHYSATAGGKYIRPLLVYAAGYTFNVKKSYLDTIALAIELIHCYSLVHDDLPAMDDDDLRRGRPSCHRAFDEATAILVGDALQSCAFELLSHPSDMPNQVAIINTLAKASGSAGMAGGQSLDMQSHDTNASIKTLETIHRLKTGALITASVRMGALASTQVSTTQLEHLELFSDNLGLAFQIRDDILDIESTEKDLGKSIGKDQSQHKATYPALHGFEASRERFHSHIKAAQHALEKLTVDTSYFTSLMKLFQSSRGTIISPASFTR